MKSLTVLLEGTLVALLAAITGITFYQVIGRYLLQHSPPWSESAVLLLITYLVFFSIPLLLWRNQHISFEFFWRSLPNKMHPWVELFSFLLISAFGMAMCYFGYGLLNKVSSHQMATLGISEGFNYVPIVLSGVATVAIALRKALQIQWK